MGEVLSQTDGGWSGKGNGFQEVLWEKCMNMMRYEKNERDVGISENDSNKRNIDKM